MNRKKKIIIGVAVVGVIGLAAAGIFWRDLTHNGLFGVPVLKAQAEELQRTFVTAHLEQGIGVQVALDDAFLIDYDIGPCREAFILNEKAHLISYLSMWPEI